MLVNKASIFASFASIFYGKVETIHFIQTIRQRLTSRMRLLLAIDLPQMDLIF